MHPSRRSPSISVAVLFGLVAGSMLGWGAEPDGLGFHRRLADEISNVDPAQAGWQSESFSEAVAVQMKSVAKLLVHPEELDAGALGPLVAGGFVSGALRPGALELINAEGGAVRISGAAAAGTGDEAYRGAEGFARALVALAAVLKIRGRAKDKGTGY